MKRSLLKIYSLNLKRRGPVKTKYFLTGRRGEVDRSESELRELKNLLQSPLQKARFR